MKSLSVFFVLDLCMRGRARVSVYGQTGGKAGELLNKDYNDQQEAKMRSAL